MDRKIWSLRATLPLVLMTGMLVGQMNSAFAHDPGSRGDASSTSGCGSCHSGGTGTTTVAFGGIPTTSVAAGSSNTFTFTISGGPAMNAGLSVVASSGTLATTATESTIATTGELIHTAAATMSAGSKTYTFTWAAPAAAATVTLRGAGVSGNGNGSDTLDGAAMTTATITVTGGPVVPSISGPTTGTVGVPVTFDSSNSTGDIVTRNWNFGDNGTGVDATGVTAMHSYAAAGPFTVTLTLIDSAGASTTKTQVITISPVGTHLAPVANAGGPYTGTVGTAVTFSSAGSSVDSGLTATYSWDFGDASTPATLANPSHTYATPGTFTVKLTVTDNAASPLSSTVTTSAVIAPATPPAGSTGQASYDANCASCHGPKAGPAGADGSVAGESADDIREAIQEVPTMQSLSTLTSGEISAIATYLRKVSKGEQLYIDNCESCHGPGGTGGDEVAVLGASKKLIKEEILTEPEMASLKFLLTQEGAISAIAEFLDREHDDLAAKDGSATTAAAGALDWLTLIGVGAWGLGRRRKK